MKAINLYRISNWLYKKNLMFLARLIHLLVFFLFNSSIPPECEIGESTRFQHSGIGVVIHGKSKIGKHCLIGQGVTIGGQGGNTVGGLAPIIENNVFIGPGARIIGNLTIGHDSIIGANAVVTKNVDPFSVMAGVPARKISIITKDTFYKKYKFYYGPKNYNEE